MLKNCRGQGVLEATLSLPVVISALAVFAVLLHRGLFYYWADYQLHEALLCQQLERTSTCRKKLEQSLNYLLLPGSRLSVSIAKSRGHVEVQFHTRINPKMRVEKNITWH